jgi:hypothetical protein
VCLGCSIIVLVLLGGHVEGQDEGDEQEQSWQLDQQQHQQQLQWQRYHREMGEEHRSRSEARIFFTLLIVSI